MKTALFQSHILLWQCGVVFDSLLLLLFVSIVWLAIRRFASPQWGIALFLLVLLKAAFPLPISVPNPIASLAPSRMIEQTFATKEHDLSAPTTEIANVSEEAASIPPLLFDTAQTGIDISKNRTQRHRGSHFDEESGNDYYDTEISAQDFESAFSASPIPDELSDEVSVPPIALSAASQSSANTVPVESEAVSIVSQSPKTTKIQPFNTTHSGIFVPLSFFILAGWGIVVAFFMIRGIVRQLRFHRLLGKAKLVPWESLPYSFRETCRSLGIGSLPVYEFSSIASPAVYGLFRPKILLPEGLLQSGTEAELRWILLHELAHIRRFDCWYVLTIQVICVLFFFNPAVWVSRRMIHRLREFACDDFASFYSNVSPLEASEAFMKILRGISQKRKNIVPALAVIDSRNSTMARMKRLLDTERPLYLRFGLRSVILWFLLAAICLPHLVGSETPPPGTPNEKTVQSIDATKATSPEDDTAVTFGFISGTIIDPQGKPVANADVEIFFSIMMRETVKTKSNEKGEYRLPLTESQILGPSFTTIRASAIHDGKKMIGVNDASFFDREQPLLDLLDTPIPIEVRPVNRSQIIVRNEKGEPVSGAKVEALIDFVDGFQEPFSGPETDSAGRSFLEIPDNVAIRDVWVMKGSVGMDYLHNTIPPEKAGLDLRELRYRIAERLPEKIELTLRGADKYTLHVQNLEGQPIAGASVGPWILTLPGQTDCLNLSCSRISDTLTDASGNAVLDWIPVNRVGDAFECRIKKGNLPTSQRPQFLRGAFEQSFTFDTKTWNISGTVFDENGEPLPGVLVEASWRTRTLTDDEGKYRLQVTVEGDKNIQMEFRPPSKLAQRNLVPGIKGVDPSKGETTDLENATHNVDYSFKKGTPVHMKIVVNDGKMSYQEMLQLTKKQGRTSSSGPFVFLFGLKPFNKDGTFSVVLSPGKYKIPVQIPQTRPADLDEHTMYQSSREVEIPEDPEEREKLRENGMYDITFRCETIDTVDRKFQVLRVDPATGEKTPEKNAIVYFSRDFTIGLQEWKKVVADENGVTIIRRSIPAKKDTPELLAFLACSQDGSFSGLGYWKENHEDNLSETKTIELHPAITLKGRFATPGGQAYTEGAVKIAFQQRDGQNNIDFLNAFQFTREETCDLLFSRPDAEGRFEIKGLFPNFRYAINLQKYVLDCDDSGCSSRLVNLGNKEVTATNPGVYDVGNIICTDTTSQSDTIHPAASTASPAVIPAITGKVDVAALEAEFIARRSEKAYELTGTVVDSKGNPTQNATIILREYGGNAPTDPSYVSPPVKTDHQGKYRISTGPVDEDFYALSFFVTNADDTERAIISLRDATQNSRGRLKISAEKPLEIKLVPIYSTKIIVKDKENQLLPGATIHAMTKGHAGFVAGTTDARGEFLLKLPEGIALSSVYALKSKEGIDYALFENEDDTTPDMTPKPIELKLEGVLPRKVQAVDEQGRVLVGLPLRITSLHIPGKSSGIGNLPCVLTDEQGVATFDFLPPEVVSSQYDSNTFSLLSQAFLYPIGYNLKISSDKQNADGIAQHVLSQCATINGRALKADGSPVSDLHIFASPSGNFWNSCFTDAQGRYTLRKLPNVFEKGIPDVYRFTARGFNGVLAPRNGPYTVIPWLGFDVKPGEKVEHDLQATEGTLLRMKFIINDGEISFQEYKESLKNRSGENPRVSMDYQYVNSSQMSPVQGMNESPAREYIYGISRNVDEKGELVFRVPPGAFKIRPTAPGTIVETVDGQKLDNVYADYELTIEKPKNEGEERVIECRFRIQNQKTYTLRAVRADDPAVVLPGVSISVYPDDRNQYDQTKLVTNEKGEATITRTSKPITYLAFDHERNLGASEEWLEIPDEKTTIDIPMYPLVKAKGKLVISNKKPFANKEFTYRMWRTIPQFDVNGGPNGRLIIQDGEPVSAKTDEQGHFEFDGLVRNTEYNIMVSTWNEVTQQNDVNLRHSFNTEEQNVVDLKTLQ